MGDLASSSPSCIEAFEPPGAAYGAVVILLGEGSFAN